MHNLNFLVVGNLREVEDEGNSDNAKFDGVTTTSTISLLTLAESFGTVEGHMTSKFHIPSRRRNHSY